MQLPNYPGLPALVRQLALVNFVETGMYLGNGIGWAASAGFAEIWSCDFMKQYVHHCRAAFPFPGVHLHLRESVAFLHDILPVLQGRTLFWLDAHFPVYYGTLEGRDALPEVPEYPLYTECQVIRTQKKDYQQ